MSGTGAFLTTLGQQLEPSRLSANMDSFRQMDERNKAAQALTKRYQGHLDNLAQDDGYKKLAKPIVDRYPYAGFDNPAETQRLLQHVDTSMQVNKVFEDLKDQIHPKFHSTISSMITSDPKSGLAQIYKIALGTSIESIEMEGMAKEDQQISEKAKAIFDSRVFNNFPAKTQEILRKEYELGDYDNFLDMYGKVATSAALKGDTSESTINYATRFGTLVKSPSYSRLHESQREAVELTASAGDFEAAYKDTKAFILASSENQQKLVIGKNIKSSIMSMLESPSGRQLPPETLAIIEDYLASDRIDEAVSMAAKAFEDLRTLEGEESTVRSEDYLSQPKYAGLSDEDKNVFNLNFALDPKYAITELNKAVKAQKDLSQTYADNKYLIRFNNAKAEAAKTGAGAESLMNAVAEIEKDIVSSGDSLMDFYNNLKSTASPIGVASARRSRDMSANQKEEFIKNSAFIASLRDLVEVEDGATDNEYDEALRKVILDNYGEESPSGDIRLPSWAPTPLDIKYYGDLMRANQEEESRANTQKWLRNMRDISSMVESGDFKAEINGQSVVDATGRGVHFNISLGNKDISDGTPSDRFLVPLADISVNPKSLKLGDYVADVNGYNARVIEGTVVFYGSDGEQIEDADMANKLLSQLPDAQKKLGSRDKAIELGNSLSKSVKLYSSYLSKIMEEFPETSSARRKLIRLNSKLDKFKEFNLDGHGTPKTTGGAWGATAIRSILEPTTPIVLPEYVKNVGNAYLHMRKIQVELSKIMLMDSAK